MLAEIDVKNSPSTPAWNNVKNTSYLILTYGSIHDAETDHNLKTTVLLKEILVTLWRIPGLLYAMKFVVLHNITSVCVLPSESELYTIIIHTEGYDDHRLIQG